ncbi:hypothetical protein TrVE_jg761 [Triparma verrucosa]|uniref:Post-GPI attachment to proteins factor 3 n=1 Tax=Triparma verrucosa TaxID=1606542 RepID=A0A9W7KRS5_9STRA|nr:hypothetical protein TrVE_jg761 [Triparma verrucosa]
MKDYEDYLAEGNEPDPIGQCNINLDLGKGDWDGSNYSEGSDKTTPPPAYFDFPVVLSALRWDCKSLCNYSCNHSHAQKVTTEEKSDVKYYGKWAFVRVFGIFEFMSFLACFLNGFIHLYYLSSNKLRPLYTGPEGYRMKTPMIMYSVVSINSFFWSCSYYVCDNRITETMDQFFAVFTAIFTFWIAVYRTGGSGQGENLFGNICAFLSVAILAPCLFLFAFFVYYMTSFGKNAMITIRLQLVLKFLHALVWVFWSFLGRGWGKGYRWKGLAVLFLVNLLTITEVVGVDVTLKYDVKPYFGLFDFQSIWLLYTVPLTLIWYSFLMDDAKVEVDAMNKKKK